MFESVVLTTAKLNKIKQDTILKNFWKNNDRFADLFNTFLFNGEEILKSDDLTLEIKLEQFSNKKEHNQK